MDISIYFSPLTPPEYFEKDTLGYYTSFNDENGFPSLDDVQIAIIGVKEERGAIRNKGCSESPDEVRREFYNLYYHNKSLQITDLGNIEAGATKEDTFYAVSEVIQELIKKNIFVIIIGGGQDITYANYLAYEKLEQTVNLSIIDNQFNIGETESLITSQEYLNKIILHQPNYLFNASVIGYQTYFVSPTDKQLMEDLFFDTYRLGQLQSDLTKVEPTVRNADMISVDVSAIRNSDFPANNNTTPNGFYGEQICQILRYAGMSDKLTSIGLYEFNSTKDSEDQISTQLMGQMLWSIIEGFSNRKKDFPIGTKEDYVKYRIHIENTDHELVFYKSDKSDRWWMEIPYPPHERVRFERHHLVPCDYQDYVDASRNHIPNIWWQTYRKLQ